MHRISEEWNTITLRDICGLSRGKGISKSEAKITRQLRIFVEILTENI